MATQIRNDEMVTLLTPDFDRRYEPNNAWRSAKSAHLALPVLRAYWPMSSVNYTAANRAIDVSGQGNHLSDAGGGTNVLFGFDPAPRLALCAQYLGGANQYLTRADGGAGNWADILGTEAYVPNAQRGLTLGGWFYWTALPGAVQFLMAKDDVGANRQYQLVILATNQIQLAVRPGPVTVQSAATISAGWNHCVGRYDQNSQTLVIYLNGAQTNGVAGAAPAALADSAAPFTIGADGAGTNRFTGYSDNNFLCACSINTSIITALFQQTRAMYGV